MANNFTNTLNTQIGTSGSLLYTPPLNTQSTIIGLNLANVSSQNLYATIRLHDNSSGDVGHIIRQSLIPAGSNIALVGGDQKIALKSTNYLSATSSLDSSLDVITSVLEIS